MGKNQEDWLAPVHLPVNLSASRDLHVVVAGSLLPPTPAQGPLLGQLSLGTLPGL